MRFLAVCLAIALAVTGCATPQVRQVKHETIRFVNESEAVRLQPVVTILSAPTAANDELKIRLTRKVHGPLYEVEVTEEEARSMDVRRIFVVALTTVTAGGINFSTSESKTIVRSQPKKIKDVEEVEQPWPSANARLDIEGITQTQLASDPDGLISIRIGQILKALNRRPAGALKLTVSASNGVETDTKLVELGAEALRSWFEQSPR